MPGKIVRIVLVVVAAINGVGAVAGGIGLMGGSIQMPAVWLHGSPFSSYLVPGLALLVLVGGSSLLCAGLVLAHHPLGILAALAAGLVLVIFEGVEFAVLGAVSWLQPLFLAIGLVMIGLALLLVRVQMRRHHPEIITSAPEEERQLTGSGVR